MPRYVVERVWDDLDEEQMKGVGFRSNRVKAESFPDITWEHSHVVTTPNGDVKTFCIYRSPNEALVHEHAEANIHKNSGVIALVAVRAAR